MMAPLFFDGDCVDGTWPAGSITDAQKRWWTSFVISNQCFFSQSNVGFCQWTCWQCAIHTVSKERGGDYHAMASCQGVTTVVFDHCEVSESHPQSLKWEMGAIESEPQVKLWWKVCEEDEGSCDWRDNEISPCESALCNLWSVEIVDFSSCENLEQWRNEELQEDFLTKRFFEIQEIVYCSIIQKRTWDSNMRYNKLLLFKWP